MAEQKDACRINEVEFFEHLEALAIAVELGLEIDVGAWPALAIAAAGLLHAQRHVAVLGEVAGDELELGRPAGEALDRVTADALNQEQSGVFALALWDA